MFAVRNHHLVGQVAKVLALLVLFTALTLLVFTKSLGATPLSPIEREPALLLPELTTQAMPLSSAVTLGRTDDAQQDQVWRVMQMHRNGELNEAVIAWTLIQLPPQVEEWQQLATAAALLELGNWEEAAPILKMANELYPDNPVVHYYQALLHLEQAAAAHEWNDALGPTNVRLAIYPGSTNLNHPRSFYELLAIQELERTLRLAENVPWDEPLVDAGNSVGSAAVPRVGDLLQTLGAKAMVANSHNVLGELYLKHGDTTLAEKHMDEAVGNGACVFDGYRELGKVYVEQGRHLDAARAYAKAIEHGEGFALPTQGMLENLWKGMLQAN